MAWICDKNGNQKCEIKKLSYNGTFMEVPSITVTIESPIPIDFAIGDYIEWDYDGLRYTLDTAAGVEKQARKNSIGNAFVYENLVFLSPLQAANNVDFLDAVIGDTTNFLTNTEFSFYGTAWDYAKRLEANLSRLYGAGTWKVRIWTSGVCYDDKPAALDAGAWESKLVDVSQIKCLGGFQQIYDIWGCGYVFSVKDGVNYVDFYDDFELYAKTWKQGDVDKIFAYGKGNGLYKIRHTPDSDHVLVTRLRAYGSSENLPANYYLNSPDYHVDGNESSELAISNLMLPASEWTKDNVKQPANAYLEQNTDLYGVREASVAWDGSDEELGEIKPTIYGLTIQDLLDLMTEGTSYRPISAKWPDTTQRIDKIITGSTPTDNGVVAESGFNFTVVEGSGTFVDQKLESIQVYAKVEFSDLVMGASPSVNNLAEYRVVPISDNVRIVSFDVPRTIVGSIANVAAYLTPYVDGVKIADATFPCVVSQEPITILTGGDEDYIKGGEQYKRRYYIHLLDTSGNPIVFSTMRTGVVTFHVHADITFNGSVNSFMVLRNEYSVSFNLLRGNKAIDKFFSVTVPQIGFDLAAAVTGNAKLCMRSGANQPREFQIVPSSVRYDSNTDTWYLRCKRLLDSSLQTYFPNSNTVIAAGDEYYFSGIAMPSLYVEIAARKLLKAAKAWLELHSKPRMLSSVDIDNKIMAEEGIVLKEGMSLPISDTDLDISPDTQESRVIDNIRIEEGSDAIRTFSITLRDKKEKSSLDAAIRGATSDFATNSSVSDAIGAVESKDHGSLSGRDMPNQHPITAITGLEDALTALTFFQEDGDGNIKLKDQYSGLWANGFISAGGISDSGGSASGGIVDEIYRFADLGRDFNDSDNDVFNAYTVNAIYQRVLALEQNPGGVTSVAGLTGAVSASSLYNALGLNSEMGTISTALQSLQSQIDSVSARDMFDELSVTSLFADTLSAVTGYFGAIDLNGTDLATSLSALSTAIANEVTARNTAISNAITTEASARNTAIADAINALDSSTEAVSSGYFLTGITITNGKITARTQSNSISGSAARLSTASKTAWGRTYWTSGGVPDNISGDMSSVGSISMNGNISGVKRLYLADDVYFEYDADTQGVKVVNAGLWTESYLTAGGQGSTGGSGGTGVDLASVWASLQNTSLDSTYDNEKIVLAHIPELPWSIITSGKPTTLSGYGITDAYTKAQVDSLIGSISQFHYEIAGSTASVSNPQSNVLYLIGPTGSGDDKYEEYVYTTQWVKIGDTSIDLAPYLTKTAAAQTYQTIISDLATIRSNAANGNIAYNDLTTVSAVLQSLQAQIDSVATRDAYDELTATVLFADIATASTLYAETIMLGSADLATTLGTFVPKTTLSTWAGTGNITTLGTITTGVWHGTPIANDYLANKTIGVGNATVTLGGSATLTQIGIPAWAQKASLAFSDMPAMYIGNARVQNSAQTAQNIGGLGNVQANRFYLSDDVYFVLDSNGVKLEGAGLYTDYFLTAGGIGPDGGSGGGLVDAIHSYSELGDSFSDSDNDVFNAYTVNRINTDLSTRIAQLEGGSATSITTVGAGNVVTDISKSGTTITVTKGTSLGSLATLSSITTSYITDLDTWIAGKGYVTSSGVTSVGLSVPMGLSVSGSPVTTSGTLAITFASGYSIPTTAQQSAWSGKQDAISDLASIRANAANGNTAYGWGNHANAGYLTSADGTTISTALQSLQAQIDSVATRDMFDELNATVLNSDIVTASTLYAEAVTLNGADLASSLSSLTSRASGLESRATSLESRATTLEGYFTSGVAKSALRLSGTSAYSIWGVEYWAGGVPKSVTGRPNLYIGTTQVQTSGASQDLNGIASLSASGLATIAGGIKLTTTKKIYFGDNDHYLELDSNGFHFSHGVYSDSFMTAGGAGSTNDGSSDSEYIRTRSYDIGVTDITEAEAYTLCKSLAIRDDAAGYLFCYTPSILQEPSLKEYLLQNIDDVCASRPDYVMWIGVASISMYDATTGAYDSGAILMILRGNQDEYYYYIMEV